MIKEMNAMEELKDIMLNGDKFENNDFYPNVDVSDGSSYDGFINFTDGFVTVSANYTPHMDSELTFNGGDNEEQKNRAKNAQLILDEMLSPALYDFYDWNIKGKDDNEWFKEFPTFDEFKDWYDNYTPYQKDPNPSLFDENEKFALDPKHDELWDEFNDFDHDYYLETPAFIGVQLKLYDNDNYRNDLGNGKHLARLESYFNDDLSYGRESIGSWARLMGMTSADGSDIGNHYIYLEEFGYDTFDELKSKLKEKIGKCYDSLGLVW